MLSAASGAEGARLAARSQPSAIVLDTRLPDGSGIALLPSLRAQAAESPVLVITAHHDALTTIEAMKAGALGERVRSLQERVVGLTRKDVPARLAQTLLSLATAVGGLEGRTRALHGVTQQDLADLVGASRSFVSTLINQLKRDGVLASQGRALLVKDEAALAKVAAG